MMKKNIFLIIAATAISCAACQKESSSDRNTDYLTTLNFTSGNLSTKTIADAINKTILWEKGDKIGVAYTVDGTWQNASGNATNDKPAKIYTSNGLDAGGETAVFNISGSFNATNTGVHQFYSVYPSSCVKSTDIKYAPSITMTIPSIQTPTANSFDSAADLMIGKATKTYNSIEEAKADEITLLWQRLVSHADIILKGFQGLTENETINSIILTADADAKLVGERWIDIQNGNISEPTSITNANVLTINGTNININNNDVEFWVAIMPATVKSLNVVVETTKATYTRSIETCNIEFKQNARKGLIIDMSGVDRVEREEAPDYSGEWLIVDNDVKHSCLNYGTGKFYGKYDMIINDGVIHETQELSDCKMILKRNNDNGNKQGLYTIQDSKGLYIKCNGEKNIGGVTSLDDACYWKITYDEEKALWKITSTTTTPYYLLYNTSSPRFTTYTKTSATVIDIKLFSYKDVRPLTDPILSADKAITSPAEGIENGTMSITVKNIETVNTSVDGTVVTSASVSGSILTYTISENTTTDVRKGSITLSADGVDDVTIEVTQKAAGAIAEPKTKEWDLTKASTDWTKSGCELYFGQPYGIKKVNAYIVNKSISDFTNASKISVSIKSLCNGATTSKLTVYLVDSNGNIVGDGNEITPDNKTQASQTTYKEVVFDSIESNVTGIMVKCTTFGKNVLINGVKYTATY